MATIRDIVMYEDVGFDATHKHCLDFPNETDRDNYFSNLRDKTFFRDANYNKVDNILNLECEWETGLKFSYCSLTYGNKKMFFFVTGCKVVNEKVTGFQLQMDIWQTFLFDFKVGEAMITREHVDRWDISGNMLWKRGVSEDTISNYIDIVSTQFRSKPFYHDSNKNIDFYYAPIHLIYLHTENGSSHYRNIILPIIYGISTVGLKSIWTMTNFGWEQETLEGRKHPYLITGNFALSGDVFSLLNIDPKSVISISYQPLSENEFHMSEQTIIYDDNTLTFSISFNTPNYHSFGIKNYFVEAIKRTTGAEQWWGYFWNRSDEWRKPHATYHKLQNFIQQRPIKPNNNDDYSPQHEPEMFKEPYIKRSISDCDGALLMECSDVCWFEGKNIYFSEMNENQGIDLSILFLDDNAETTNIDIDKFNKKASMGLATRLLASQLDVPSEEWKSYLISSRDTDRQMLQSTINQTGITSTLSGAIGMGGISGMAGSGKGGNSLGFNKAQAGAGFGIGVVMGLANWGVNNYFGWEQQEIKEKAIRNQPNNLLRASTGDGHVRLMLGAHSYNEKKCNANAYKQASERYHKFGYRVDMMGVPNIKTRKHFNFVQTSQIRIEGSMNQSIRDAIADIFNNGVTIWHGDYITKETGTNKFVTNYRKENIERSLI